MKNDNAISFLLTGLSGAMTALQTDVLFQYIQLGITILSGIVALAFTIYKWYKSASDDGKITPEEIEDLREQVKDHFKEEDK